LSWFIVSGQSTINARKAQFCSTVHLADCNYQQVHLAFFHWLFVAQFWALLPPFGARAAESFRKGNTTHAFCMIR